MGNITLTKGVAVNLYAATGIAVGTQLNIQNLSGHRVLLADSEPGLQNDYRSVERNQTAINDVGATGAWAITHTGTCEINVRAS